MVSRKRREKIELIIRAERVRMALEDLWHTFYQNGLALYPSARIPCLWNISGKKYSKIGGVG